MAAQRAACGKIAGGPRAGPASSFPLRSLWKARLPAIRSRRCTMRVRVLLQITGDDGTAGDAREVAAFEKATERPEDLGLSIAEGKALLAAVQQRSSTLRSPLDGAAPLLRGCGQRRRSKGSHPVVFLTLYGDVRPAQPAAASLPVPGRRGAGHRVAAAPPCSPTTSPRSGSIWRPAGPRWCRTPPPPELLADVLPVASGANATTLREHTLRVAERAEAELGEERPCFIDGCPADWAGAADPGRAHRGRPRWRLCPRLGRPEDQLRGHRRPVGARRP